MERRAMVRERVKLRWWNTRLRVFHKKINRSKYYGVKALIEEYTEAIMQAYLEAIQQALKTPQEKVNLPSLLMRVLGNVKIPILKINELLEKAFMRGGRRVFTRKGDKIEIGKPSNIATLRQIQNNQMRYLKGISEEMQDRINQILQKAVEEGKSIYEIKNEIVEEVKEVSRARAERIARSEIIRASAEGTKQGMREAGIERYIWLSARDNRVCETCRALDGKKFKVDDENAPIPVRDSHPNCRCILVADI